MLKMLLGLRNDAGRSALLSIRIGRHQVNQAFTAQRPYCPPDAHACSHHVVLSGPVMSARKKFSINYPVLYATEADCKNEVRRLCAHLCPCVPAELRWDQLEVSHITLLDSTRHAPCINEHLCTGNATHFRCVPHTPALLPLHLLCFCVRRSTATATTASRGATR